MSARRIGQNFFQFEPRFKVMFQGNDRLPLTEMGTAERRRFRVVRFDVVPLRVDLWLLERLKEEGSRILWWMTRGCLEWCRCGLPRVETDMIREWTKERCIVDEEREVEALVAYEDFKDWCRRGGYREYSLREFKRRLEGGGFKWVRRLRGGRISRRPSGFRGLGLP